MIWYLYVVSSNNIARQSGWFLLRLADPRVWIYNRKNHFNILLWVAAHGNQSTVNWWTFLGQVTGAHSSMNEKKHPEWRKHCVLAVVRRSQFFFPPQTPFPGAWDGQNLIRWRWSLPTNPVWWRSMHAISSYHGNRPTHAQHTDRTDYNTLHC